MTVKSGEALPSGPFELGHRSLQSGLREWIGDQTGHPIGYLEQLYTFADGDRSSAGGDDGRTISISYLGLVREQAAPGAGKPGWHGWYEYSPWEDHRRILATAVDVDQETVPPGMMPSGMPTHGPNRMPPDMMAMVRTFTSAPSTGMPI